MIDHQELDRVRDLVVATLDGAKSDAQKAFATLSPIFTAKIAGKLTKTIAAATKRGRRPPATLKVQLGGRIGAEFRAKVYAGRDGEWTFAEIEVSIVTENRKNPRFAAVITATGIRWRGYEIETGERMSRIVAGLLSVTALGQAHFVALNESNHCQICGRALVDERSVEAGVGPECIRMLFGAADAADVEAAKVEDLVTRIKAIRLQMKAEHPDAGGSGDGALFSRLSDELKQLRKELAKSEVRS